MNTYFSCFCDKLFGEQEMDSHFRNCPKFKKKFKGLEEKVSRSIKNYVDNLNISDNKKYINGLLLLKFFLKRYVNLLADIIEKNIKENDFTFHLVSNEMKKNKNDINLEFPKYDSSNLGLNNNKKRKKSPDLQLLRKNTILDENLIGRNIKDNTFEIIFKYCERVYKNDTNFDEDLLRVMSYSLSALTSKECFVIVTNDNQDQKVVTKIDDKRKFYGFKYKEKNFYILLY